MCIYIHVYIYIYIYVYNIYICMYIHETKTPRVQKKGEAKKNQQLKALISTTAKNYVKKSDT